MPENLRPHFALFIANLIYGINYSVAKDVMPGYIEPFGFILCRAIGAGLLFWLFHRIFYNEKIERKDFGRLIICGFFGVAANQMLFFKGLNITTPINAAIIMTTNPVLVLLMASVILKELISLTKITGIILGLAGAIILILFKGDLKISSETLPGDLMVLANAACYGVYLVLVKPLMHKYKPLTVIKWVFLFGFIFILPFGFGEFRAIEWSEMPLKIWMEVAFVVIGTTFFAYFLNIYALKKVTASVVSIYIYFQPVLAAVVALLMGKDSLDIIKITAAFLIFTGVYLVSKKNRHKPT